MGIGRARDLAEALAVRAQLLRDGLATALVAQIKAERGGKLLGLYGAFHHPPEALLAYIYAVLHAPAYCTAYAELLRSDFPRIPFPESGAAFMALAELGAGLVEAHLLRAVPKRGLGGFGGKEDERIEAVRYSPLDRRIHINATQGFGPVPPEIWKFTIDGYQVLDKYLKSRRGRLLSLDEIELVEAVVNVLAFTIDSMADINAAYCAAFNTNCGS